MKVTMDMSKQAYEIARSIPTGNLSSNEAKLKINKKTGMNPTTAQAFITVFLGMLDGTVYKRTFNQPTHRFLLESIRNDYGEQAFRKALNAVQLHVDYYATTGNGKLLGLQKLIDELEQN